MRTKAWVLATLAAISTGSPCLSAQWAMTYGGIQVHEPHLSGQSTRDGGYVANSYDAVIKIRPDGSVEWARTIQSATLAEAAVLKCVRQTQDGGYIVLARLVSEPGYDRDRRFWIVKLSPSGAVEWQSTYGGEPEYVRAAVIRETLGATGVADGYLVTGAGPGGLDAMGDPRGLFLLKVDLQGNVQWQKRYEFANWPWGERAAGTLVEQVFGSGGNPDGYLVVTQACYMGYGWHNIWAIRVSSDGTFVWGKYYSSTIFNKPYSVRQVFGAAGAPDGFAIVGSAAPTQSNPTRGTGLELLRLAPDGSTRWMRRFGGTDVNDIEYVGRSILPSSDGGYVVAGQTSIRDSLRDAWVLKLAPDGTSIWQKTYGTAAYDIAHSIDQAVDGGYLVGGMFGTMLLVMKLDGQGSIPDCGMMATVAVPSALHTVWVQEEPAKVTTSSMQRGSLPYVEGPLGATGNPVCAPPLNRPPVAHAGPDQIIPCACSAGKAVTLNGFASSDADGDPLSYTWTWPFGTLTGAIVSSPFAPGTFTVTLTVNDGRGGTATDELVVTVQADSVPPQLTLSQTTIQATLPTASAPGATVDLSAVASATDNCTSSVPVSHNAPPVFPIGVTAVTFTATDACGNTSQKQLTVRVVFRFGGILPPVRPDGSSIFNSGRVVPIKFQLTAANGAPVRNAEARLRVRKLSDAILGTTVEITPEAPGSSNADDLFRYDVAAEQYIYNLSTVGYGAGTYVLEILVSDGTTHAVQVSVR